MVTPRAFERLQVWPIEIRIKERAGVTLWARVEDADLLLALGEFIIVCTTWGILQAFSAADHSSSNLSGLAGYQELQPLIASADVAQLVPSTTLDFNRAAIFLDRLGYIERLRHLAEVVLAPAVVQELRAGVDKPGSTVPDLPWVRVWAAAEAEVDEILRGLDA